jgi:hypothetical protein
MLHGVPAVGEDGDADLAEAGPEGGPHAGSVAAALREECWTSSSNAAWSRAASSS